MFIVIFIFIFIRSHFWFKTATALPTWQIPYG
jgi:hypothetical protein